MMSINSIGSVRQQHTLSPRLQQAVRLLQMSSQDFAALMRDAAASNPFLEMEDESDAVEGSPPTAVDDFAPPDVPAANDAIDDRLLWLADGPMREWRSDGDGDSAIDSVAGESTLADHLYEQLIVLRMDVRDLVLAQAIVDSLDDDGYLRSSLDELLPVLGLIPQARRDELQLALKRVQALEPAGVGARDIGECLRLQLTLIEDADVRALARTIIDEHLPLLGANDMRALARRLNAEPAVVEKVCDRIRHLDPRPGWRYGSSAAPYVIPDIIVAKTRGTWRAQLNPAVVPKVRLNEVYAHLFQRHRDTHNGELGAHLQEARWTVHNVERRFATILDVAEAIVQQQAGFFEYGAMAMKPLLLREIADAVGVHESTVSRVSVNKYMATPSGIFAFKHFFSRTLTSTGGSACSGTAIRELLKEMIDAEDAGHPLSDVVLTRLLLEQGLPLARRTVTKYRQMLKIESAEQRRRS